jgi:hypothetical protein
MERLLPIDQKIGDGVAGGIVFVRWGRMLRTIDKALESRWRSNRGVDVRSHHAHPPNFKVELGSAHRAIAHGVLAVAYSAVPPVPASWLSQGHRRNTVATIWYRLHASNGRMVRFSRHQVCHGDDYLAGKDSQPRIGKRRENVGVDEGVMTVEVADEG